MGDVAHHPHLLPDRIRKSADRPFALVLQLRHTGSQHALDNRRLRVSTGHEWKTDRVAASLTRARNRPGDPYFRLWPSLDDSALHLGDEEVSYGELLLIGAASGLLDAARADTRRALSSSRAPAEAVGGESLRKEAAAFRRERGLHSGEDLKAWLGARGLDESSWADHLRRTITLRSPEEAPNETVSEGDFEEALIVDLACSGWWARSAREATRLWSAERAAARRGVAVPKSGPEGDALASRATGIAESIPRLGLLDSRWCAERLAVFEQRRLAMSAMEAYCSDDERVSRRIADHDIDWISFVYDEVRLTNLAAAKEAVMCARDDGLKPEEIAARAGVPLERRNVRQDKVPSGVAAVLAGAVADEVVGPFEGDNAILVIWLEKRIPPSPSDPQTRKAAIVELLDDELERASAGKDREVGPL